MHLPASGVWFVGDLVEESGPPVYGSGSFPLDWPATIARLRAALREGDVLVPGHGAVVDAAFLAAQQEQLAAAAALITELHAAGVPKQDAVQRAGNRWPFPEGLPGMGMAAAIRDGYAALARGSYPPETPLAGPASRPVLAPATTACRVVSAEPLHRRYLPVPQQRRGRRQRVAGSHGPAAGAAQGQPGPAGGAADRLRVEPPVRRVVVLRTETRATSLLTVPVWRGRALSSQTMTTQAAIGHELRRRAGLPVLAWPALDQHPVDALVTTRHGGVSSGTYATLNLSFGVGDRPRDVLENRRRAAAALGADLADVVFGKQVHGAVARVVTGADRGRGAAVADEGVGEADALVTSDPGTVLGALVADCVPIVLYDPGAHVLACVHAGWRGTVARVADAALAAMAALGTRPADVVACFGPAIGPDRYQVGEEVAQAVRECLGERAPLVFRPDGTGRWLCDLWSANRLLLREAGVADRNIHVATIPTGGDFFSNRKARPCGRFGVLGRLRPRDGSAA